MMRASTLIGRNALTAKNALVEDCLLSSSIFFQCVRWKRKPIWLPTAKTKVFRVPPRPVIPMEDHRELQRLYNRYRTGMNSLMKYIIDIEQSKLVAFDYDHMMQKESEDFARCMELNSQWNAQVAKERDARLQEEKVKRELKIAQEIEDKKERDEEILKRVDAEVRKAKEDSASFITPANIDEAIENALNTTVNYNFALDPTGKFGDGTSFNVTETNTDNKTNIVAAQ